MSGEMIDTNWLTQQMQRLRGNVQQAPDAAVIVPVNAQADLNLVLRLLTDVAAYHGAHRIEVVVVINNYPVEQPPAAISEFEAMGVRVVAVPNVRRVGEAVAFTARMHALRTLTCETAILFDADCRIINATALLDWYIRQFERGAKAAYTHVAYYDVQPGVSVRVRVLAHHASRWAKRTLLRIPTTRGSNYAVHRSTTLALYEQGYLADEMNVGPTVKAKAGPVVYSGARQLVVLTSGRYLNGGWQKLGRYLMYRLRYNLRVLPVRENVASRTDRRLTDGESAVFLDASAHNAGKNAQQP